MITGLGSKWRRGPFSGFGICFLELIKPEEGPKQFVEEVFQDNKGRSQKRSEKWAATI
jgi:hypothetical protein